MPCLLNHFRFAFLLLGTLVAAAPVILAQPIDVEEFDPEENPELQEAWEAVETFSHPVQLALRTESSETGTQFNAVRITAPNILVSGSVLVSDWFFNNRDGYVEIRNRLNPSLVIQIHCYSRLGFWAQRAEPELLIDLMYRTGLLSVPFSELSLLEPEERMLTLYLPDLPEAEYFPIEQVKMLSVRMVQLEPSPEPDGALWKYQRAWLHSVRSSNVYPSTLVILARQNGKETGVSWAAVERLLSQFSLRRQS